MLGGGGGEAEDDGDGDDIEVMHITISLIISQSLCPLENSVYTINIPMSALPQCG